MLISFYDEYLKSNGVKTEDLPEIEIVNLDEFIESRYHGDLDLILTDCKRVLEAATYSDFINTYVPMVASRLNLVNTIRSLKEDPHGDKIDNIINTSKFINFAVKQFQKQINLYFEKGSAAFAGLTDEQLAQLDFNNQTCREFLEYAVFEQIQAIDYYKYDRAEIDKLIATRAKELCKRTITRAKENGALTVFGEKLPSITRKNYKDAFTWNVNKYAYLALFNLTEDEYQTSFDTGSVADINRRSIRDPERLNNIDLDLFPALFEAFNKSKISTSGSEVTVYVPKFAEALGYDITHKEQRKIFFEKLESLRDVRGIVNRDNWYATIQITGGGFKENTLTFHCPYFVKLIEAINNDAAQEQKKKKKKLPPLSYTWLLKSSFASNRNKRANEIVKYIIGSLARRGTDYLKPGMNYFNIEISYKTIIDNDIILAANLENADTTQSKNSILKRAFKVVPEYLRNSTLVYEYYKNLEINMQVPTVSRLNDLVIIKHDGKNPAYKENDQIEFVT